jgi:hypothetical protein
MAAPPNVTYDTPRLVASARRSDVTKRIRTDPNERVYRPLPFGSLDTVIVVFARFRVVRRETARRMDPVTWRDPVTWMDPVMRMDPERGTATAGSG